MRKKNAYIPLLTLTAACLMVAGGVHAGVGVKVTGNVYGGGNNAAVQTNTEVNISAGQVDGNVFGGGNVGNTKGNVNVNITGGTVVQDVYGGGALADTNTGNWNSQTSEWVNADKKSSLYTTTVNLLGGTIKGDAYGGGLGRLARAAVEAQPAQGTEGQDDYVPAVDAQPAVTAVEATVYGDITVSLGSNESNGEATATAFDISYYDDGHADVVKSGRVFGCNNLNGSPQGSVTVDIRKTVKGNKQRTAEDPENSGIATKNDGTHHNYHVAAVYGGGNLADYTATGMKTKVIVETCDVSIEYVYGGGNAAPVPETDVLINGAYEISEVFGGGNGRDEYTTDGGISWQANPGANVNGNATTLLKGGYVHAAYGGSNRKGTITGNVTIDTSTGGACTLDVGKIVGAGKDADVNGDLIMVMGCKPSEKVPLLYAGADNANVNGNVELTITSGNYGKVFGGNNQGGAILGHIKLNIEETGDCSTPITIDELYLGGNEAAYSVYGYYLDGDDLKPRTSATDEHTPVTNPATDDTHTFPYAHPELNIISCTYIGKVFGGGLGTGATIYGNPTVNVNMIPGAFANDNAKGVPAKMTELGLDAADNPNHLGIIRDVYGGGNAADVIGNPTVNIGTAATVTMTSVEDDENTTAVDEKHPSVLGAYIMGNVFGGGKGKDDTFTCEKGMIGKDGDGIDNPDGGTTVNIFNGTILGSVYGGGEIGRVEKNTVVNIGYGDGTASYDDATSKPVVKGNVFGAGKGLETHGYAALVRGNPTVTIQGNAKVLKSVYGGGEIASVARYQVVNGVPQALAQVKEGQHSGWCTVNVRGYAEIGPETKMKMYHESVAEAVDAPDDAGHVFAAGRGVLPENYTYDGNEHRPKRMLRYDSNTIDGITYWEYAKTYPADYSGPKDIWQYFKDEDEYFEFIQTLALATQTSATISGNALVKGSVYGGSENGLVQYDTNVTIEGNCQIGCGKNTTGRHPAKVWGDSYTVPDDGTDLECASWEYDGKTGAPYDPYAIYEKDGKYYYDAACTNYADGGAKIAKDGHTYYGNVFGGGSGSVPYFDTNKHESRYIMTAGWVKGNTHVTINGGHILTNVYGGCEATNVDGTAYVTMTGGTLGVPRTLAQIDAHPVTCYLFGAGKGDQRVFYNKSTNVKDVVVNITGGRIYGSVFGGGEDGHVLRDVTMTIGQQTTTGEGNEAVTTTSGPTIGTWGTSYVDGNVFGGGRGFGGDAYTAGNVAGSVKMEIKGGTMLGSIYGGGRLGSVGYGLFDAKTNGQPTPGYGEMRADTDTEDGFTDGTSNFFTKGRGHIDITISGGTIGNTHEYIVPNATNIAAAGISETDISKWTTDNEWKKWKTYHHIGKTEFDTATGRLTHTKGGNVFAGGMGRFYQLDGTTPISSVDWWKLGNVKSTKLTITGGTIKSSVYGGGELGMVQGTHTSEDSKAVSTEVTVSGGVIGTEVKDGGTVKYTYGSVFGGGYGSLLEKLTHTSSVPSYPKYIAGRVKGSTAVTISGSAAVKASVYGGGEMAAVGESKVLYTSAEQVLGETLTGEGGNPMVANTYVTISGGTIGKAKDTENDIYYGGAKMGNVYGGGSGYHNTVRSGHIYGNTNVNISGGTIYHNIYGGGAYGTVGDFTYETRNEGGAPKVYGVNGLHSDRTGTGTANVTITGGTIGIDGNENGMVFGSSRGDINRPGERDDHTAWTYETHVTIGTPAVPASGTEGEEGYVPAVAASGPAIKGTVYGSGENGHVFHDTYVTVNGGTIGIADSSDPGYTVTSGGTTYSGAAYPYRGNVYGSGCGTDKYDSDNDGVEDKYNPLAGVVYGNTNVSITGGLVVRNVYGAGAMGSAGRLVTTTGESPTTTAEGGLTTISVSGGTIGISGTEGDGNIYGAARGSLDAIGDDLAQVWETSVTVSGGTVKGNVYGGGELGDVGYIDKTDKTNYNYTWKGKNGSANSPLNNAITGSNNNTGLCTVSITGGTIGTGAAANADGTYDNGNVFGGGKGSATTWWCERAIAYASAVSVSGGTVHGSVYGGGEVGRVEDDAKVTIGTENATGETPAPTITGSVFGAGKGLATHGYSALVRGNSDVTVQGTAQVGCSVYGGGEIASVGKFTVDKGLPKEPKNGGTCTVTVRDHAVIGADGTGHNVYGACKGVTPAYNNTVDDANRSKSMQLVGNAPDDTSLWSHYNDDANSPFIWRYYPTEAEYLSFLRTLALTSNTHVTISEQAAVRGSVFGGGERGITLGGVEVNIAGGTVHQDVYGGGSLADSNTSMWDATQGKLVDYVTLPDLIPGTPATGYYTDKSADALLTASDAKVQSGTTYYANYKTRVSLTGGTVKGSVYGGGLGQLAQDAVSAIEAKVYGDVLVKLNESTSTTTGEGEGATTTTTYGDCEVKGNIFGCNNLNGSPQGGVTVHVYKTVAKNESGTEKDKPEKDTDRYELKAVYGGGNLAAYYPDDATTRATAKANVIIDGCDLTSIETVYGGGNAASVPETDVIINGTYEIGQAFGGGNGADEYVIDGKTYENPGANVGYMSYAYHTWDGTVNKYIAHEYTTADGTDKDASTKDKRETNYGTGYGEGKAHVSVFGGTVHEVYAGSNTRGNIRVESRARLVDADDNDCEFNVIDAYGGGRNALQDGDAILDIGCITGLGKAYGGASNADVNGNVILNITNGTYGQVFGGNDAGGFIHGSITVNIEETGCNPIIIGELYGGGNQAAYSVYGYNDDGSLKTSGTAVASPTVNVRSFTSIGRIFGGGYGNAAKMVGDPTVNINVLKGDYENDARTVVAEGARVVGSRVVTDKTAAGYDKGFPIPSHSKNTIGAIQDVFGGGNAAEVVGTPHVMIGTSVGDNVVFATPTTATVEQRTHQVEGVDIRGNVFGGGNNATVTGNTNVEIGKKNDGN